MRALVIFGSKSDKRIYAPFIDNLKEVSAIQFEVLSAHRNPKELEKLLKNAKYDLIIAGAGLAAHLPGVVASKTDKPVFGLPVNAHLAGLDALLSIVQMPYGVPVLSSGIERGDQIISFIENYQKKILSNSINLIINPNILEIDYVKKELTRTVDLCNSLNITVQISSTPSSSLFNIQLITCKEELKKDLFSISVPLLSPESLKNPKSALDLMDWINYGGTWVGTNNTRNAILFFNKLNFKGDNL